LSGNLFSTGGVFVDTAASLKESRFDAAGAGMRQTTLSNRGLDKIEQLARGDLWLKVGRFRLNFMRDGIRSLPRLVVWSRGS
jgi:hypothetical protein